MVDHGLYDFSAGKVTEALTEFEQQKIASSLLVCIYDIFLAKLKLAFKTYPEVKGFTLVGGVAGNKLIKQKLAAYCVTQNKFFIAPSPQFCTDNGAMIAFVGSYKAARGEFFSIVIRCLRIVVISICPICFLVNCCFVLFVHDKLRKTIFYLKQKEYYL